MPPRSPHVLASLAAAMTLGLGAVDSRADDPGAPAAAPGPAGSEAAPAEAAILRGRVYVKGSLSPLPGAEIVTSVADPVVADEEGRFELRLPPGEIEVVVQEPRHVGLRVVETLVAGRVLTVEYRLAPNPAARRYESTARGQARLAGERFTLKDEELRTLPGTLGDPFRVIALLPGVTQPLPVLPVFVVRGATPGMNGFFLDGIRVPQLFHFLAGGGVVHPRLVERLDFYPGGYDASFGRYAGGIIDSETRAARKDGYHMELELKLYDISGVVELSLPRDVRITIAGHYGWPGVIIQLIQPGVDVQYGDYQLRLDWKGLTVQALGSYDSLNAKLGGVDAPVGLQSTQSFHRVQVRYRGLVGRFQLEAGVVGGVDEIAILAGQGVRKLSVNARLNARGRFGPFTLRVGGDVELSRFSAERFADDQLRAAPDELGELYGDRDGVVAAAFVLGDLDLLGGRLQLTLSGRADVYHAGAVTLLGAEPRATIRVRPMKELALAFNVGLFQQPPSFPVALPGIDTFALSLGLQRAVQASTALEVKLPQSFTLSATGFYQRFYDITDVVFDFIPSLCSAPPPDTLTGVPARLTRKVDGSAYGLEVLLRRSEGRVTGWLAYTLSRATREYDCGRKPADYDQSHVLNFVLQARLPWNLIVGGRLAVSTGRPYTQVNFDGNLLNPRIEPDRNNERLPTYVQLDLRIDREWIFKKWALDVFIECVNVTYSQALLNVSYPSVMGIRQFDKPQVNGFNWILPSIGLRGRF